jgi:hypothetical protein
MMSELQLHWKTQTPDPQGACNARGFRVAATVNCYPPAMILDRNVRISAPSHDQTAYTNQHKTRQITRTIKFGDTVLYIEFALYRLICGVEFHQYEFRLLSGHALSVSHIGQIALVISLLAFYVYLFAVSWLVYIQTRWIQTLLDLDYHVHTYIHM